MDLLLSGEHYMYLRSQLPDESKREMDFADSSFFRMTNQSPPTLAQVKALSNDLYSGPQPNPVIFEDLNLLVKLGRNVKVPEAQCLWMIKRVFHDQVLVLEDFGWLVDEEGYVFIYMELIRGPTLNDRWDDLDHLDKAAHSDQLCDIVKALRLLKQDSSDQYIGSISRQPLLDYAFKSQQAAGPFTSIKAFNDWFSSLPQSHLPVELRYKCPYRENIIISSTKPSRALAILDWKQSGWYPDYWGYCTALYTRKDESEWRQDWVDKFLDPRVDEFLTFIEYTMAIGAV